MRSESRVESESFGLSDSSRVASHGVRVPSRVASHKSMCRVTSSHKPYVSSHVESDDYSFKKFNVVGNNHAFYYIAEYAVVEPIIMKFVAVREPDNPHIAR